MIGNKSMKQTTRTGNEKKTIGFLIKKDSVDQVKSKSNKYLKNPDENEFTAVYANKNDDDLNTTEDEDMTEDDEDDNDDDYEQEDQDEPINNEHMYDYHNKTIKIDENLSFVEDDYGTLEDFAENGKLHASINQYKQKFLGSVNIKL